MVLMCADCQAARGRGSAPLQVIAAMRQRLAAGEEVARMYQEPGLAWLERQAEVADSRVSGCTTRQRVTQPRERWGLRLTATGGLGLGR